MKALRKNRFMSMGNTLYDAAKIDGNRSNAWIAWPLFAEKEFTQYTRESILKKKRWLEANLSVVPALIKKVGRFAIGEGLHPQPETTDTEWNEIVRDTFIEWASNANVCDAIGRWNFWDMQRYAAENLFGEGEAFFVQTETSVVHYPQVQAIDNTNIRYVGKSGMPTGELKAGEYTYWDGVKLDRNGKAVAYSYQYSDGGDFIDIPVNYMIHLCDRKRPDQVRAISPFHSAANSAVDSLDLKAMETQTTKLHSALGILVKRATGEGVQEGGLLGDIKQMVALATNPNGTETPTEKTAIGENFFSGGAIAHLGAGDDIKLLSSERPTINVVNYLAWLYKDVATAVGVPVELIWNMAELGSVPSRVMLADAQMFFDHIRKKVAHDFCRRVYNWWISVMMNNGTIRRCNDPKFWHCKWTNPRKITIDKGQVNFDIQAMDAGITNLQSICSENGVDWQALTLQRISEVKFMQDQCKAAGVDYSVVFPAKPGSAPVSSGSPVIVDSNAPAQAQASRPAMLLPPHLQEQFSARMNDLQDFVSKAKQEASSDGLVLSS